MYFVKKIILSIFFIKCALHKFTALMRQSLKVKKGISSVRVVVYLFDVFTHITFLINIFAYDCIKINSFIAWCRCTPTQHIRFNIMHVQNLIFTL